MMLNHLELFLLIIEKGGLSAAGRELGLSPASVSERLAALESHYGVALLTRTTRSIMCIFGAIAPPCWRLRWRRRSS